MSGRGNFKTPSISKAGATPATGTGRKVPSASGELQRASVNKRLLLSPQVEGGTPGASKLSSFDADVMELLGERFVAYNENLLAVAANQIKRKQKTDLENSIQSQLNAISRRLVTDQQMVGNLEKRLSDVKFMSATSEKLDKQESEFTTKLKNMEDATDGDEKTAAAVEPSLHYLQTCNVDLRPGIDSFKNALTKTVELLDEMNIDPSDVKTVEETAKNLASVNCDIRDLDDEIDKLHAMVPACEEAVVAAGALKM